MDARRDGGSTNIYPALFSLVWFGLLHLKWYVCMEERKVWEKETSSFAT